MLVATYSVMVALRVVLTAILVCVAAADDLAVLTTIVSAGGNLGPRTKKHRHDPPTIYLSVGGLPGRSDGPDEHLRRQSSNHSPPQT
jgi:hypothetical protein